MTSKMYKCPHCNTKSKDMICEIFITEQCREWTDLGNNETHLLHEFPSDYDSEHPLYTKCLACNAILFKRAKSYIIEVDE